MRGGSDLPYMLKNQMNGKIDSWAIRWCYHQFRHDTLAIFPTNSKIYNIGHGSNATHTKRKNRFGTILDAGSKTNFIFKDVLVLDEQILKDFRRIYSIKNRVMNRIRG
jgi:hypothetical protein